MLDRRTVENLIAALRATGRGVTADDIQHVQGGADVEVEVARLRTQREARRRLDAEDRPVSPLPEARTLREQLADAPTTVKWRIHGWQSVGARNLLAAQFKVGKTTAVGNLVRSLVDGDPWLGQFAVVPITGRVVVLDTEMPQRQGLDWLAAQGIRADDRVVPLQLKGMAATFDLLDATVRGTWADRLRALDAQYLIVDCVRPILDALGLDEHREGGRFLTALDALLAEAGIPEALIVHHFGHVAERARGDSRFQDWPDATWKLVRESDDPSSARYLSGFGRDVDQPEAAIEFDLDTRRLVVVGGSRSDAKTDVALRDIEALLTHHSPQSGRQVVAALKDHPRAAVLAALDTGRRQGRLQVVAGPRRALLYSVSDPVIRSVPTPIRDTSAPVSQCFISTGHSITRPVNGRARAGL